ncbi:MULTISPECIES: dethiobiotin synthase [Roseivirga]|uniref:ATP-dependent dethiobiotin synthetase BioD n=3 Tax=Roseivirga TaxID=290180 RepID=A0A150XAQ5_9BACT|nr:MULTISPECIES: dethiobiotin synthase [Roseivirga]KYG75760.1 ATP-dependent dethiobiotin synthetase BioD [Roseivirga spongicola]MBO6662527.1 dethiobiotin synthase [Roseivirga sp.]MBO6909910.1 dethiobiotin synthase [Roseivirga sp.]WPZ10678.1 dethiobiotin synthase [Roseivirga spongicola]
MNYFVTAIGTDSGKTLVSSILVEALKADYWKPIQAGFPTDTEEVKKLVSNSITQFHPETHQLKLPASPHAAARFEHLHIQLDDFVEPETTNEIVVEGAGGVLVPINQEDFVIDIAKELEMEIILVANLYLGSINHTLLTVDYLKRNNFNVKGIIFNGDGNPESEQIILKHSGYRPLLHLPKLGKVTPEVIQYWADQLMLSWYE